MSGDLFSLVLAPILIGSLLALLLYGAYLVQLSHFLMHENASKERKPIRWLVAFVTLSETASVAIVAQNVYEAFALAVREPGKQFSLPQSAIVTPIFNSMIAFSVQCFFAWRIYILSKGERHFKAIVPCVILALAITQFLGALVLCIKIPSIKGDLSKTKSITLPATIVYLAGNVACDSVITASMIFMLIGFKMAVIPHATQRLLNRLMVNSIENGLVTTICVTLNLVFCVTRYEDGFQFAFQHISGRLYSNVLLASLNGRHRYRAKDQAVSLGVSVNVRTEGGTRSTVGYDFSSGGAISLANRTTNTSKSSHLVVINSTHQSDAGSIRSVVDSKLDRSQLDLEAAEEVTPTKIEVQNGNGVHSGDLVVLVEKEVHRESHSRRI